MTIHRVPSEAAVSVSHRSRPPSIGAPSGHVRRLARRLPPPSRPARRRGRALARDLASRTPWTVRPPGSRRFRAPARRPAGRPPDVLCERGAAPGDLLRGRAARDPGAPPTVARLRASLPSQALRAAGRAGGRPASTTSARSPRPGACCCARACRCPSPRSPPRRRRSPGPTGRGSDRWRPRPTPSPSAAAPRPQTAGRRSDGAPRLPHLRSAQTRNGMIRSATMLAILIIGLMAGPAVSL